MDDARPCAIGASYYPEQWSATRWAQDFALMQDCAINTLRIGEFAWSSLQPQADVWDFAWLDDFFEQAHRHDMRIMLCTPSACPPPWLIEAEPDILPLQKNGLTLGLGSRRHYSPFHQRYRQRSAEMAQILAERYGQHPALDGWQIDNELCGATPDYGPQAIRGFQQWLQQHFNNDFGAFIKALGLAFWSQGYSNWQQVPVPLHGHHHPGLQKLFDHCVNDAWIAFCAAQVQAIKASGSTAAITTNCYGHNWGMAIDWSRLVREAGLDAFSFDNYATSRHEGCFYHDLGSSFGVPYWITEQQCGLYAANYQWPEDPLRVSHMAEDAVTHGASKLIYFPWRQVPWGQEQEHGAILDHNGQPGLQFERVQQANHLISACKALPVADIGLVFSWQDAWALAHAKLRVDYSREMIHRCYHGLHLEAGRIPICCRPEQAQHLSLLVVPLKVVYDEEWEQAMLDLLARGGQVLCFAQTFARDHYNSYRIDYLGQRMEEAFGIHIERRILPNPEAQVVTGDGLHLGLLLEHLSVTGAEVMDTMVDGPNPGAPALTCRQHASGGKAWYCAGYPEAGGMAALVRKLLAGHHG